MMSALDIQRAELAGRNPGWRIWYVQHYAGGVTWCAARTPTLKCQTPDELEKKIAEANGEVC